MSTPVLVIVMSSHHLQAIRRGQQQEVKDWKITKDWQITIQEEQYAGNCELRILLPVTVNFVGQGKQVVVIQDDCER